MLNKIKTNYAENICYEFVVVEEASGSSESVDFDGNDLLEENIIGEAGNALNGDALTDFIFNDDDPTDDDLRNVSTHFFMFEFISFHMYVISRSLKNTMNSNKMIVKCLKKF